MRQVLSAIGALAFSLAALVCFIGVEYQMNAQLYGEPFAKGTLALSVFAAGFVTTYDYGKEFIESELDALAEVLVFDGEFTDEEE